MSSKKIIKYIILSIIIIIIIALSIVSVNNLLSKKEKNNQVEYPEKIVEQQPEKELKTKENITININTDLPSIDMYIEEGSLGNDSIIKYTNETDNKEVAFDELYFDKSQNQVSKEEAFENNLIKNDYTKKIIANELGNFNVTIIDSDTQKEYFSKLIVVDVEKPILELKEVSIKQTEKYNINSFIKSCVDNSKNDCIIHFTDEEMSSYSKPGTYDITLRAKDLSGNEILKSTKLIIKKVEITQTIPTKPTTPVEPTTPSEPTTPTIPTEPTPPVVQEPLPEPTFETVENVSVEYKYGTTITTTETIKYKVYADGRKEELSKSSKKSYDFSTYNGTTSQLTPEATQNINKYSAQINEVVRITNTYRSEVGAQPLTIDATLNKIASVRALEIGWANKFSHTRPDGTQWSTAFADFGLKQGTILVMGENIAYGYTTAASVSAGWKNSEGHYKNMIDSQFNKIGVGVAYVNNKYYWAQAFSN